MEYVCGKIVLYPSSSNSRKLDPNPSAFDTGTYSCSRFKWFEGVIKSTRLHASGES